MLKKKARSRQNPTETKMYADSLVLLANTPAQAESLLHSLEQAAESIGLNMNTNKTDYMCFKQEGAISTLNRRSLKLEDKFTYLGSNISSTESDVNIHQVKTWITIDWLSIIWKSDLSDKMKQDFFPSCGCVNTTV